MSEIVRTTGARYVRHAQRFGTEMVFETAPGHLNLKQLGRLSVELQAIDPKWRCPLDGPAFALTLIDLGVSETASRRSAQISRSTFYRHKRQHPHLRIVRKSDRPPIIELHADGGNRLPKELVHRPIRRFEPAFQSGIPVSNGGSATDATQQLELRLGEAYATARAAYERAAREGDWDAVRELVKPAAIAANRASAIHDERSRATA